jgi:hypothetical protein
MKTHSKKDHSISLSPKSKGHESPNKGTWVSTDYSFTESHVHELQTMQIFEIQMCNENVMGRLR